MKNACFCIIFSYLLNEPGYFKKQACEFCRFFFLNKEGIKLPVWFSGSQISAALPQSQCCYHKGSCVDLFPFTLRHGIGAGRGEPRGLAIQDESSDTEN